jgi:putative salt-induced outer membrane protein YdiY
MTRIKTAAGVAAALALSGGALAQDNTATTTSAQELLDALKAAGVDVSGITTVNEDGTVTVALPEGVAAPPTDQDAQEAADKPKVEAAAPPPEPDPEVEWDHKITLGASYADGNTQRANVNVLYRGVRETEQDKLSLGAAYFWAQDNNVDSENKFIGNIAYDYNLSERWLLFAKGQYDYDDFQSWLHRVQAHGGAGYRLIKEEDLELMLRAGMGAIREWGSDNDNVRPEGLLGADFSWTISDAQSFVATYRYFPDFDDLGEFRMVTTAGYEIKIDRADGLAITAGLLHEHQSKVNPGRDNNDIRIFGGLTFDF